MTSQWSTVTAPKPLSDTVKKGLAWLAQKQRADGGWAAEDAGLARMPPSIQMTGDTPTVTDTALATLALLRAGSTPTNGEHAQNIRKGIAFLCTQVNREDPQSPFVTSQRGTIVQMKMGQHFDTYVTAWALAEAAGRMPDDEGNRHVREALNRVIAKIERTQRADGSWFDNSLYDERTGRPRQTFGTGGPFVPFRPGGVPAKSEMPALAPVLGQAVAVKGLNRARQAGFEVQDAVLDKARSYAQNNFNTTRGDFGLKGSFGIVLYASASHLGAMQDSINTRRMLVGVGARNALDRDMELRDRAFRGVIAKLNDRQFLLQFGAYGGEDFLGYMLLSEAMAVKDDDTWKKWDRSMADQLSRQQNKDGSWTGHHCTTGRSFCTAAVVLVLAADRAPVPSSMIQNRN